MKGRWFRRAAGLAQWGTPGLVLMLTPKCPACLAAYFSVATGLSVSVSTASDLRTVILATSASILGFLVVRQLISWGNGSGESGTLATPEGCHLGTISAGRGTAESSAVRLGTVEEPKGTACSSAGLDQRRILTADQVGQRAHQQAPDCLCIIQDRAIHYLNFLT